MRGDAGRWLCRAYYIHGLNNGFPGEEALRACVEQCLGKSGTVACHLRELMIGDYTKLNQTQRDKKLGGPTDRGTEERLSADGSGKIVSAWELLLWIDVERKLTKILK